MRIVIVHKPSGKVIPCAQGRMDRGGSWVEPEDLKTCIPRIFTELRYARGWLTNWCKGRQSTAWTTDFESGHKEPSNELEATPWRIRSEYDFMELDFKLKPYGTPTEIIRSFTLNELGKQQMPKTSGRGVIVGESADRECWKVVFEGNSTATISTITKQYINVGKPIRP